MATLRKMRIDAKNKGINGYRTMSEEDLKTALSDNGSKAKRKSVTKRKSTKAKASSSTPAKKTAKRSISASTKTVAKKKNVDGRSNRDRMTVGDIKNEKNAGKFYIQKLKFTKIDTDVWNPREGSLTKAVFDSAKRNKGDRQAIYEELAPLWNKPELALHKKRDGSKRTKEEALNYLTYVISRTLWDFARKTGQHKPSDHRIEYGTGENATVRAKKKTRKKTATKATTKKATTKTTGKAKRGRPKGSKNKK